MHAHYWTEPLGGRAAFPRGSNLCDRPQDTSDPGAVEELMGSLDRDNGELTFPEFWKLLGNLASKQGGFT